MSKLDVLALVSGFLFGVWPLLMNRSQLSGFISPAVFSLCAFLVVVPFTLRSDLNAATGAHWGYALLAGLAGGIGLLIFTVMLAGASKENVGTLFLINLIIQASVPVIYSFHQSGDYSIKRIVGVAAALLAVVLLR